MVVCVGLEGKLGKGFERFDRRGYGGNWGVGRGEGGKGTLRPVYQFLNETVYIYKVYISVISVEQDTN